MAAAAKTRYFTRASPSLLYSITPRPRSAAVAFTVSGGCSLIKPQTSVLELGITPLRASPNKNEADLQQEEDEDGVSLGSLKLPANIDIARFETLLFQWANSLCQGANLPLPVPLKVDRIQGGSRLGFINFNGGKTQVYAYIDCVVFPATEASGPVFRAIRKGPLKDRAPPGEARIMRSLLQALQTSVDIATI